MHGLKRRLKLEYNKRFQSIDKKDLVEAVRGTGLTEGSVVCVHSSLSHFGHVKGGAQAVIDALVETVGSEGCLVMPTFSMAGSMNAYVDSGVIFDVRNSPSRVGAITESFRKCPGVIRSSHPTHSVAAWGRGAEELLSGHDRSLTPFGRNTPYGRLAENENGFMLLLGTRLLSLPHHLQERVDFPNLFLPGIREVPYIDHDERTKTLKTRVMRPKVPYKMAIPAASGADPDWCIFHDFCLVFPRERARKLRKLGYAFEGYKKLWRRREGLEKAGILRCAKIGKVEIGLLHVKPFIELIEPELRDLIKRYRSCYPTFPN